MCHVLVLLCEGRVGQVILDHGIADGTPVLVMGFPLFQPANPPQAMAVRPRPCALPKHVYIGELHYAAFH